MSSRTLFREIGYNHENQPYLELTALVRDLITCIEEDEEEIESLLSETQLGELLDGKEGLERLLATLPRA